MHHKFQPKTDLKESGVSARAAAAPLWASVWFGTRLSFTDRAAMHRGDDDLTITNSDSKRQKLQKPAFITDCQIHKYKSTNTDPIQYLRIMFEHFQNIDSHSQNRCFKELTIFRRKKLPQRVRWGW